MTAVPVSLRLRAGANHRSRAVAGDAAAFAAVYQRHHQALYRYCRSILRHEQDAQDALQSTMVRAFAALENEGRDFDLRPWLFRIAQNEAITILRQRRSDADLDETAAADGEIEDRVAEREELRLLRLDLADLPERQRAALVLRELNGLSRAEIGQVLDLSTSGVKQAISDARNALSDSREGRALACEEVRRKLSDGDGRVLRGRRVRAHLRSCAGCHRFRDALVERPQTLRTLAPPLPVASAASLLSELLRGTAAKLLACFVIAGGGATMAVELRRAPAPPVTTDLAASPRTTPPPSAALAAGPVTMAVPGIAGAFAPSAAPRDRPAASRAPVRPEERSRRIQVQASPVPTAEQPAAVAEEPTAGTSAEPMPGTEPKAVVESGGTAVADDQGASRAATEPSSPGGNGDGSGAQQRGRAGQERPNPPRGRGNSGTRGNSGHGKPGGPPAKGNAGNAGRPDKVESAPGNSGSAPGNGGSASGNSGNAGSSPGNSGNAPGQSGSAPGNSGNAPDQSGSAPGNSGNAPDQSGSAPGNSGDAGDKPDKPASPPRTAPHSR